MKPLPFILTTLILLVGLGSCNSGDNAQDIPESLEGKKALLREKRAELKEISDLVADLEGLIAEQDPARRVNQGRLVTTTQVARSDFKHYVEIQGSVEAQDVVNVTSEVTGRIMNLEVEEGDFVKQGQLISTIDTEQTESQISEIETQLDLARTVYERQKRLWDKNIGSEMQYLEAKNTVERLEKSLETQRIYLEKARIHAPISGVVDNVMLKNGEVVMPGMGIIEILSTNRLKVVADVPETFLQAVRQGEEVIVSFPALDLQQEARVSQIGRTIDPSNRTFKVEVNVGNANGMLKPNLLATMKINDLTREDVIVIPLDVVQEEISGKKFVFVAEENANGRVARKVPVSIGRSYEGQVVIEEGLQGGETLILDGGRGLADAQTIRVVEAKTEVENG